MTDRLAIYWAKIDRGRESRTCTIIRDLRKMTYVNGRNLTDHEKIDQGRGRGHATHLETGAGDGITNDRFNGRGTQTTP